MDPAAGNHYRLARKPQLLAAWNRAKHVVGGSQVEAPATAAEVPAGPEAPEAGEVKPAA